ncbi:hypothetical protein GCM10009677_18470 [Sphaerisporangium rubeum]
MTRRQQDDIPRVGQETPLHGRLDDAHAVQEKGLTTCAGLRRVKTADDGRLRRDMSAIGVQR